MPSEDGGRRKELTKSLDPSMANAAAAILDAARVGLSPAVRWNRMCSIFLELVGKNIFNPTHDATTKLLRGDIKQGSQTVLEYGMRMRVAVHQAVSMPGMAVCELFIRGLRPELINVCARTEAGLVWEDLNGCIAYANGKEHIIPKPVHSVSLAQPMIGLHQADLVTRAAAQHEVLFVTLGCRRPGATTVAS